MNREGLIYELSDAQREALFKPLPESDKEVEAREDVARLDGYLRARAEADAPKMAIPKTRKARG